MSDVETSKLRWIREGYLFFSHSLPLSRNLKLLYPSKISKIPNYPQLRNKISFQWKILLLFLLDIDECASNTTNDCDFNATCNNYPSSYNCTCNEHYGGNGTHCSPINKCLYPDMNDCHKDATCTPDGISYTCKCNGLLYGNGTHCYGSLNF